MIEWKSSDAGSSLAANEIRVYRCSLETAGQQSSIFTEILTVEERERAGRFFFARDRNRFTMSRGTLRLILGRLLGVAPGIISLRKGRYGKLYLDASLGNPPLHFNLSHSEDQALYAFGLKDEIGIDLEKIRPGNSVEDVSAYFTPGEKAKIGQALKRGEFELFYRCWVMKEAYTKGKGDGLQIPLNSFELPPDWIESGLTRPVNVAGWTITPFQPAQGYVGAVARPHADHTEITFYDWPGGTGLPSKWLAEDNPS